MPVVHMECLKNQAQITQDNEEAMQFVLCVEICARMQKLFLEFKEQHPELKLSLRNACRFMETQKW